MKFGVLGKSLPHTYSPQIHHEFGDYEYTILERTEEQVRAIFEGSEKLDGFNVTIPYKKFAASLCKELSPAAKEIGAVNTVVALTGGGFNGDNTDVFGFTFMLTNAGIDVAGKNCLILGTGGASAAVNYALKQMSVGSINFCSRTGQINYENVYEVAAGTQIIINTTPVGMFPEIDNSPVDLTQFKNLEAAADIVYNPSRTKFLQQAQELGLKTAGGLSMLVAQAYKASEIFEGALRQAQGPQMDEPQQEEINTVIEKLQNQMLNITLIGMPGSGKTTLGKKIAKEQNRKFIDLDDAFKEEYGITPAEVITQKGEDEFRQMETQIAKKILPQSGLVIATGGGIVTRKENWFYLRANSKVIYLERSLNFLLQQDTSNRPLSQNNKIEELYKKRAPLYEQLCDKKWKE